MKLWSLVTAMLLCGTANITLGGDKGTSVEAVALVKKGVALVRKDGRDRALEAFNNPKGPFVDRDLYIFVIDIQGTTLANGINEKLIGKNVLNMTDSDGNHFIKKMIEIGAKKGRGFIEYKWSNPVNQSLELKKTYVERVGDMFISCGSYPEVKQ
jgi:cytochrome c